MNKQFYNLLDKLANHMACENVYLIMKLEFLEMYLNMLLGFRCMTYLDMLLEFNWMYLDMLLWFD